MDIDKYTRLANSMFDRTAEAARRRAETDAGIDDSEFGRRVRSTPDWNERQKAFANEFGVNATPEMIRTLLDSYESKAVDVDGVYDILTANVISQNLARQGIAIPSGRIMDNLDEYRQLFAGPYSGKDYTPKDWYIAVRDSFAVSFYSTKKMLLGIERMTAEGAGREEDAASINEQMRHLNQQIENYSDPQKRNPVVTALKWAAQSSVYTAALVGVSAIPYVGPALGFAAGTAVMAGGVYNDLRDAGVEAKNAAPIALGVGALCGVIETQLGVAGALVSRAGIKTLQGAVSKRVTGELISRLGVKGVWAQAAIGVGTRYALQAGGEGLEEILQELSEIGGLELANLIQKEGIDLSDKDRQGYVRRVWDAGVAGFGSALVMGFIGVGADAFATTRNMVRARDLADATPSFEAYKKESKPLFNGKLSDEEIEAQQKIIHEGRRNIAEREQARAAEELMEAGGLGEGYAEPERDKETGEIIPLGETYHKKNGQLHTELDEKRKLFKVGDPRVEGKKNLYAHIGYTLGDDGTVRVNEFEVRTDLDTPEFRRKIWGQFTEAFAGHKPVWEAANTREAEIIDELKKNNPYGTGLNYYPEALSENIADEVTGTAAEGDTARAARMKLRFGEQMARHLPGSTEASRAGAVRLIDRIGRSYGYTFDRFIEKLGLDPDNLFTDKPGTAVTAENAKAAQFAKEGGGSRKVRGALQPWVKLNSDMKAVEHSIVYLDPGRADYSTVIHELKHAVDNFLEKHDPELFKRMMDAAGEYDPKNSGGMDENTWRRERSSYAFETYLQTGEAPTAELRGLFRQMKEWLKEIVKYLNDLRKLTPAQKEAFDELLSKADKVAAEREASEAAAQSAAQGARIAQDGQAQAVAANGTAAGAEGAQGAAGGQQGTAEWNPAFDGSVDMEEFYKTIDTEGAQEAATAQYEANKRFNEERPLLDKNNGKGDPKPKQPSNDLDEVYRLVEESREEFDRHVEELRQKYGGEVISRKELKSRERAERKITPENGAEEILDINGKTLVLDDLQSVVAVMQDLHGRDEVVRMKDRYKEPLPSHYRDTLANIRMSNGAVVELQLNTKQMLAAKEEMGGHLLYEIEDQVRTAERKRTIDSDKAIEIIDMTLEGMRGLYDAAFNEALGLARHSASSFGITELLEKISENLQESGASSIVLSEKTRQKLGDFQANTRSSQSRNINLGSSNEGTSAAGLEDADLSTGAAEADITESSNTIVPSTNSITHYNNSVNSGRGKNSEKNSPENEERIAKARERYRNGKKIYGAEDQITLPDGETRKCRHAIIEAGIMTASADSEKNFTQNERFPANADGTSMNVGRDYTGGFAHEAVYKIAADFDQRGDNIIGDENGIVLSGNNRYQSAEVAARNGTNKKYLDYLKLRPERWGFAKEDIAQFERPVHIMEVEAPGAYTPRVFDIFNLSGMKSVSPIETAIKMSYLVGPETVKEFSTAMGNYDSINELYEDAQAVTDIFRSLMKKGIVTENSYPEYVETVTIGGKQRERVTANGREFLESAMLGAALNKDAIRSLALAPEIRRRAVKGLAALVDNAAMGEYSVVPEINQAIAVAVEVQSNKKKYGGIKDYADQAELELGQRVSTDIEIELAGRLLEKTEYGFADMMGGLNAVLREEAAGQGDMFGSASKDDILRRYLGVKAKAGEIRAANNKVIESEAAAGPARAQAALGNAGLARMEAEGALFQLAFHGSPYINLNFDNSTIYEGSLGYSHSHGWGHTFYSRKEAAEWVMQAKSMLKGVEGKVYEAEIPDDHNLLHWEKSMAEQPEAVQKAADSLITWDKDGKSNFKNPAYNLRKFKGGNFGFFMSINGKAKWGNIAEAQAAARAEIKKTLTGKEFYNTLAESIGAKETSLLLDHMGIKGTKFFDKSTEKIGVSKGYNYVIYGDRDIQITGAPRVESRALVPYGRAQAFFQLDEELVEEAAEYDSWREFRDAYEPAVQLSRRRREDSVMPRQAANFAEAEKAGKEFAGRELTNRQTGMAATVSNKTLGKMLSVSASDKSVSPQVHALAVANVDHLYERAELLGSHDDESRVPEIKQVHRFGAVMQYNNEEFYPVKITVKEYTQKLYGTRIYTVEAVDIEKEKPAGQLPQPSGKTEASGPIAGSSVKPAGQLTAAGKSDRLVPIAGFTDKLLQMVDSVKNPPPIPSGADNAWYRSLWNDAKKIHEPQTFFQEDEEKTSRAGELDKRWAREADKEYLTRALLELNRIHNDQSLEPAQEEDDAAHEEYRRVKRLQRRISADLPNAGSVTGIAAQVKSSGSISSGQYDRLKDYIRKNTRDFRAVFADIMGQDEYLEDLAETKDGEPAGRLADPRPDKQDDKARLKEIADAVRESDPALAKEIEDGTARYDDPRIAAFEAGAEAEYKEAKAALDALEKETAGDFARLANDAQRQIVRAWEGVIAARVRADETDKRVRSMADEAGKIAGPYLKQQRLEQAGYEQAYKAYNDLVNLHGKDADVREAIARREAKAAEKERLDKIHRKRRAAKALQEMKLKHLKRITRMVKFGNVAYEQAVIIKTIQRLFLPSIVETGDRFVGTIEGPLLRHVWGEWQTDEEYREALWQSMKNPAKAEKLEVLLGKPWDFLTKKEKQQIIKLLPKTTVTGALRLRELEREYREDAQLDIEEKIVNGDAHLIVGEELEAKVKEAIGEEMYRRIRHKPLAEWTPGELEELARTVDGLAVEGRRIAAAKREARRNIEQRYRNLVLDMIQTGGIDIKDDDTPEEKERKRKELAKIAKQGTRYQGRGRRNNLMNNFFDANLRRWTTAMDGGRKGVFTDLFYWMENDAYNKEQTRIAARRLLVETVMKEKGIRLDELYQKMEIPLYEASALFEQSGRKMEPAARELGLPESTWDMDAYFKDRPKPDLTGTSFHDGITVDDLLYIMRGIKNEQTRKAIIYGNLSTAAERAHYKSLGNNLDEIAAYENIGYYRLLRVLSLANDFFAKPENKKFLDMAEAIGKDFDQNGEILNRACIEMFDRPMWRVDNYVPMSRMEQSGEENQNRIVEDLLGIEGAGFHWAPSGFKEKRIDMSPYHQAPVKTGLYKTWAQSVTDTEHFMAYGPVVQRLNAVFKGYNAAELREALYNRWGGESVQRVDNTIAKFANPNPTLQRTALDEIVRWLRGKTATAYLAWKMSGILKQMATSPWPYLQEIPPHEYIAACIEVAGGAGKVNDMIREKSIFMKNRDFDPMVKLVREAMEKNDNAVLSKLDQFNALGMKGLEWVDWIWVAPGWLATYKRELANVAKEQEAEYQKLLQKYQSSEYADVLPTMESKANKALSEVLSDEQQDAEAVARADDAVRRMQPSSRSTDIAPLFENRSELANMLLQFQMALNVIWQNIRYDLPLAIKEKQVGTVVGMVGGYMAAGICLGMLSEIGNDDDDDEEGKLARRILFYSFTQFTDAVPVIGDAVTRTAELAITGKTSYAGGTNELPVLGKAFGGAHSLISAGQAEDPEKRQKLFIRAVKGMGEAVAISRGLPVSGVKELGRAAGRAKERY